MKLFESWRPRSEPILSDLSVQSARTVLSAPIPAKARLKVLSPPVLSAVYPMRFPQVRFQLIDTGRNSWGDVAEKMISTAFKGLEAGLLEGEWVKPSLRAVSPAEESITPLEKNDLVLVTGGARGIVFECVHKLAVKTGCRLAPDRPDHTRCRR